MRRSEIGVCLSYEECCVFVSKASGEASLMYREPASNTAEQWAPKLEL